MSQDEKIVAEEKRLEELEKKTDRSEEETKEFKILEDGKKTRFQRRIDEISSEAKAAKYQLEQERIEREKLKAELEELKAKPKIEDEPKLIETTIEIDGKKYYTDEALISMIKNDKISEAEAYKYQRNRDRIEDRAILRKEMAEGAKTTDVQKIRIEDAQEVLKEYPKFNKNHPEFNAEDPLYKLATQLWSEAYAANPKGLSLAVKRAKEILRISDTNIDRSDDLNIEDSTPAPKKIGGKSGKEITLSDDEKDMAIKMYTKGDVLNPKTGRAYTINEALSGALEAKKERMG